MGEFSKNHHGYREQQQTQYKLMNAIILEATPVYTDLRTAARFDDVTEEAATWTGADIMTPYNITVNSSTGEFYITDARNYTSSGRVYAFGADHKFRWSANTGDIPAKIAFLSK